MKIIGIKDKIMRKAIPCCFLFILVIFSLSSTDACKYTHKVDKNEEVNAIYVSQSSRHSFPQQDYTYSFPVCDENDVDILNTLEVEIYTSYTKGTYSISIDYTDSDDAYVHRQTGYLVTEDLPNVKKTLPPKANLMENEHRIIFDSGKGLAPQFLNSTCLSSDGNIGSIQFSTQNYYHMENCLLPSLYNNNEFFKRIKDEIPSEKTILGICIKIYSSYDFCGGCQDNILKLLPCLQEKFSTLLSYQSLPLTIFGLAYRPYGHHYRGAEGIELENPRYGTDHYPQDKFLTFNGTINGGHQQSILPIYLYTQPDTPQSTKQIFTLGQEKK